MGTLVERLRDITFDEHQVMLTCSAINEACDVIEEVQRELLELADGPPDVGRYVRNKLRSAVKKLGGVP